MKIKKSKGIEAISFSEGLALPNLHILVRQYENNLTVGHCLDFDIHAYSEDPTFDKAIEKVFYRICDMAIIRIMRHLKNDTLDYLFANYKPIKDEEWGEFYKTNNGEKIKRLRKSYIKLKKILRFWKNRQRPSAICLEKILVA